MELPRERRCAGQVLLSLSGGVDSCALLRLLAHLAPGDQEGARPFALRALFLRYRNRDEQETEAEPTPATHAILTRLKAGEPVCQTLFVPKLEFQTLKTLCQTLFVPKTASETLFSRPSMFGLRD